MRGNITDNARAKYVGQISVMHGYEPEHSQLAVVDPVGTIQQHQRSAFIIIDLAREVRRVGGDTQRPVQGNKALGVRGGRRRKI